MCSGPHFEVFLVRWAPVRSTRLCQHLGQTLVKPGQTWSSLVNLREMHPRPHFEVILMWWVRVGSNWLGPSCLVLCADIRENFEGKNGVMTVGEAEILTITITEEALHLLPSTLTLPILHLSTTVSL